MILFALLVAHRVNSNEQEDRRGDNYVKHCTL